MRENGVRSLAWEVPLCHHEAVLDVSAWQDQIPVPEFGPRMVCTNCGVIGADARPNWKEQPERESLTGDTVAISSAYARGSSTAASSSTSALWKGSVMEGQLGESGRGQQVR